MPIDKLSHTSGHFELVIDGHVSTAYLKSVDGGFAKAQLVDEPLGPTPMRVKHTSTVEIEPFTIDFGMSGANDVLKWIQDSWNKKFGRRNGSVSHANFDLKKTFEHEFMDALIAETSFPTLDGASKDPGYMKIKIHPEVVTHRSQPPGATARSNMGVKQKLWTASAFRFSVDGVDGLEYANKIEAFTIKQGIKKMHTGPGRFPQLEPTKIEFPNIVGTVSVEYAGKLLEWHRQYVMKGQRDTNAQKTGYLEFLSPQRDRSIFRINMADMGLASLQILPSQANQDAIKRVKFELFVGKMEIDGPQQLGMEAG